MLSHDFLPLKPLSHAEVAGSIFYLSQRYQWLSAYQRLICFMQSQLPYTGTHS